MPDRTRLQRSLLPVAVALGLSLLDAVATGMPNGEGGAGFGGFPMRLTLSLPPWLIAALLFPLVRAAFRRVPLDLGLRAIAVHAAASIGFALLHTALMASYASFRYYGTMSWLQYFGRSLFWNLVAMTLLYWLYGGAGQLVANLRALHQREQDALQLRSSLAEARLAGLRAQLNPHFLYNVLNTAAMLAREQRTGETVEVLARLGELLRYVLREGASGESELRDEVDFLRRYLELERIRFADRLQVQFEVDPALAKMKVPSLLLQPLVENAVRHGIALMPGAGHIAVRVRRAGSRLELEVQDNGPGAVAGTAGEGEGGVGLRNTRDRLSTRYGDAARLTVGAAPGGGTLAVVTLPCEEAAP